MRIGLLEILVQHPLIHWLVHHAAYVLTRFVPGDDGLTPYHKMHGRTSMDRIAEFGERVLWFVPAKRKRSLEPKWRNGIFIGRAWGSDQNFIALLDGSVTRARAMVRTTPALRWDTQRCKNVAGTPIQAERCCPGPR